MKFLEYQSHCALKCYLWAIVYVRFNGKQILRWKFALGIFIKSEGNGIGQKEKLKGKAVQTKALINDMGSTGSGMSIQSCSKFRQRDQALNTHTDQVLNAVCLWEGGVTLGAVAPLAQGHNLGGDLLLAARGMS